MKQKKVQGNIELINFIEWNLKKKNYKECKNTEFFAAMYLKQPIYSKKVIVVEQNSTSQLSALIREHTGFEVKHKVLKYDSRPMPIDWLYNELNGIIK